MSNVGLFFAVRRPPLVPDVLLSLDVELPADLHPKRHRSYFVWEYGKVPDVVIEVVSNREGGEDSEKLAAYARIAVRYYVIFDPDRLLGSEVLRAYRLDGPGFRRMEGPVWFPDIGLGLRLLAGPLRGPRQHLAPLGRRGGCAIPTGHERAERLAEQLRQLGVEPAV